MIFLNHAVLNNPTKETISAGLGPIEQYGIIIILLIVTGVIYFLKKRKKSR